jgi:hypothetical protein
VCVLSAREFVSRVSLFLCARACVRACVRGYVQACVCIFVPFVHLRARARARVCVHGVRLYSLSCDVRMSEVCRVRCMIITRVRVRACAARAFEHACVRA